MMNCGHCFIILDMKKMQAVMVLVFHFIMRKRIVLLNFINHTRVTL